MKIFNDAKLKNYTRHMPLMLAFVAAMFLMAGCLADDDDAVTVTAATADWNYIQPNILATECACHASAGGSAGLSVALDKYATIVTDGLLSSNGEKYVEPGSKETSYIYMKITKAAGIAGSPMPMGGYPMAQADIDLIGQWIDEDALESGGAAAL